jgi:hypothetical protein
MNMLHCNEGLMSILQWNRIWQINDEHVIINARMKKKLGIL